MRPALGCVLLLLAACGDRSGGLEISGDQGTTTTAPAEDPVTLTCGEGLPFESPALAGPTGAETAEGEANDLLRAELAKPHSGGDPLPTSGWRTLAANEQGTLFGAGDAPDLSIVQIWADDNGLDVGPTGGCRLRPYREGSSVGRWELANPDAAPSGTDVELAVSEINCSSEPLSQDRLQPPEVVETTDAVTVTVWITDPEGDVQTCAAGPPVMVTVHLDGPLGGRSLLDDGQYPPAVVIEGSTGEPTTTTTTSTTIDPRVSTTVVTSPNSTTTARAPGPPPEDPDAATKAIEDAYRIAWDGSLTQAQRVARVRARVGDSQGRIRGGAPVSRSRRLDADQGDLGRLRQRHLRPGQLRDPLPRDPPSDGALPLSEPCLRVRAPLPVGEGKRDRPPMSGTNPGGTRWRDDIQSNRPLAPAAAPPRPRPRSDGALLLHGADERDDRADDLLGAIRPEPGGVRGVPERHSRARRRRGPERLGLGAPGAGERAPRLDRGHREHRRR